MRAKAVEKTVKAAVKTEAKKEKDSKKKGKQFVFWAWPSICSLQAASGVLNIF